MSPKSIEYVAIQTVRALGADVVEEFEAFRAAQRKRWLDIWFSAQDVDALVSRIGGDK